ncbi:MAG TPA: GDP-mannose 4,6-dehydratase, partial [Patescibacteria group bacterium]|nr:GDP-mannose 4,6-dehydratase [Patescibacteria group bacterium]
MKLLVTGGAGFIGSNFIRYWLKHHPEDSIVNLDKLTYAGHLSSTKDYQDNKNYTFVKGDVCDASVVSEAMKDAEVVVHFAAETHVDRSITGPKVFLETNVVGTQVLLDAALEAKVKRFHHISTDEVFGALSLENSEKFSENTPYNPRSPYSASKAASDHLVRSYFHTWGLPITITNCSNNFGPYQDPEKFLPRMITDLIEGNEVKIYGDGKYVRDWLY